VFEVIMTELDTLVTTLNDFGSVGEGDGVRGLENEAKRTILDLINDVGEGVPGEESGASRLGLGGSNSAAI
jgi:hypothetical protein